MKEQILIGADFVPTDSNCRLFETGDINNLFGEQLIDLMRNASYRIFNLEVPLVDVKNPIAKCGPNLISPTKTINGYKAIGVDLLTLANNHILDQGENGLFSTINVLKEVGISFVGAGKNLAEAMIPHIFKHASKKVGIYACTEHEFTIATEEKAGANPFDPLESYDHIIDLKRSCDFLIVLYHGGKEHYRYPSPTLQKICRKFVDKGANLVICQHSHCIGCQELYKTGIVIYGQGNFLFDRSSSKFWETGLLVGINENFDISFFPIIKNKNVVRLAEDSTREEILKAFFVRSNFIQQNNFIKNQYAKFGQDNIDQYLVDIGARVNIFGRILNKLTRGKYNKLIVKFLYSQGDYLKTLNFIDCEAHRDLLLEGLKNRINKL